MRLRIVPFQTSLAVTFGLVLAFGLVGLGSAGCGDDDNNKTEGVCDDGVDNDGDGLADCLDEDCDGNSACEYGTEVTCDDGIDNDGDGNADCADEDCDSVAGCEHGTEVTCDDGIDNDGDGNTDCDDDDCLAACQEYSQFTLLQTSDLHDHADGYGAQLDYTPFDLTDHDQVLGGFSRLATIIGTVRATNAASSIPTLVVDSGDWHAGTLFDLAALDHVALKFFQALGYDAITLGNHEFDWTPDGLAQILQGALTSTTPPAAFSIPIVSSNLIFDDTDAGDDNLKAIYDSGAIQDQLIIDLPTGLRVGLLGRVGPNADSDAPAAVPVTFDHDMADWQARVDALRADGADVVILLSHEGIFATGDGGGDFDLASAVTGIDIIAGGHLHILTPSAFEVGDSIIFSPGQYGEAVSRIDVTYERFQGVISDYDFQLIPVNDTVTGDATTQGLVDAYQANIDQQMLSSAGITSATPLAEIDRDYAMAAFTETALGDLVTDALRTVASGVAATQGASPFDVAIIPAGVIRDPLIAGNHHIVSVADAYNVMPLGISPDGTPGYPLIEAYLTAPELRLVTEVTQTLAPMGNMPEAYLFVSGIRYDYDPNGGMATKVSHVYQCGNALPPVYGGDGDFYSTACTHEIDTSDTTTLYKVVTDYYTILSMGVAAQYQITITPKGADGTPIDITNPADILSHAIDVDPNNTSPDYLTSWQCMIQFLPNFFPDAGGIPGLPEIPSALYGPGGAALGRAHDTTN